jgi:hypothetical protein
MDRPDVSPDLEPDDTIDSETPAPLPDDLTLDLTGDCLRASAVACLVEQLETIRNGIQKAPRRATRLCFLGQTILSSSAALFREIESEEAPPGPMEDRMYGDDRGGIQRFGAAQGVVLNRPPVRLPAAYDRFHQIVAAPPEVPPAIDGALRTEQIATLRAERLAALVAAKASAQALGDASLQARLETQIAPLLAPLPEPTETLA